MTAYLGRPAGYRRWPRRLVIAARWLLGWILWTATAAIIGTAGGILVAAGGAVLTLAYLVGIGPVTP